MKFFAFIIALCIPFTALYLGLKLSPAIGSILFSPIVYISSMYNEIFTNIPYQIQSLLIFASGIFYFLMFYFFSKLFFKKLIR